MFGLSGWTIGDPMTTEMEAIDAAIRGDGEAIARALADLDAPELDALQVSARFLADCCETAARSRR